MSASIFSLCCPSQQRISVEQSVTVCELSFHSIWTIWCHLHGASQKRGKRSSRRCPQGSSNDGSKMTSVPLRWRWRGWRLFGGSCEAHYWHLGLCLFVCVCVLACVFLLWEKTVSNTCEMTTFQGIISLHLLIWLWWVHGQVWSPMVFCVNDLGHIGLLRHDLALKPSAFSPFQYSHATLYPPVISAKLSHHSHLFFFSFVFQSGPH